MYLSRVQLNIRQLTPETLPKWQHATPYAAHQWLWQLFPEQQQRSFLFRMEAGGRFWLLSSVAPLTDHALFSVETKAFQPQLTAGLKLDFQLRANPVVCRNKKRSDVLMNAKYQAKQQGLPKEQLWQLQTQAAQQWLIRQSEQHGFNLLPPASNEFADWAGTDDASAQLVTIDAYQQHRFRRRAGEKMFTYSSVDFSGCLQVTDPERFTRALAAGLGKSKAFGCGMLMIKRHHP